MSVVGELANLRILIAEDQWVLAHTLSVSLEEEGARVIGPFATSSGAMERIDVEPIDFALVDMGLKDCFADTLIEKLDAKGIPFVVITGFAFLPTNAHDRAVEVIRKPVDRKALIEMVAPFARRITSFS